MTEVNRATFGSKLGVIMATVGCAVGLGNIWRFPYMLGENGGAAFLAVYILCIILLGLPVMLTEFFIGRHSKRNAAGAFKLMAPGTKWSFIGYNGVLASSLILGFYSVVSGWTLEYMFQAVTGSLSNKSPEAFTQDFALFSSGIFRPIFWTIAFIGMTHFIIVSGVKDGIEKTSKIMMPLLFIILFALCIRSVTLPNAEKGLDFLFKPDFSKLTSAVVLSAMGQAFFSLSIGMGCLITYSSYFDNKTNMQNTALQVTILDTLVAVLAGVMIFPAVFSFGIAPTAGPELVFITLPNVFQQAFGNIPWLAILLSLMFYILLALAALTSTISLHEVVTAYLHEEFKFSRSKAARYVTAGCIFLGVFCSLSLGIGKSYTVFGLNLFDLFDFVTAKLMLPLGGFFISIFIGWYLDKKIVWEEVSNNGTLKVSVYKLLIFILKYIAPIGIALIFINELGFLK